ncbi:MAG: DUF6216 family protein [Pigmentiphaga sp.]|uniref:DUF6216 family protein n=1 Tax=Pigmentiphaga sp. TaxID=1977564 RepID=UPI0029AC59BA|nr:DUF6216 family protein [Pigmentiphaga sp.]MDX3906142.1 DUF6216 family protein [Pigmentiphaga sp.]
MIRSVLDPIWSLIAGRAEVEDPVLKSLLQKNRDLEKFRFVYRLKAGTLDDVGKLAAWLDKHSLDISRLQKMRRWVDPASSEIVLAPPARHTAFKLITLCLAAFLLIGASLPGASTYALFQMRTSKVWFKTDAITVQAVSRQWSFDADECKNNRTAVIAKSGFVDEEVEEICGALYGESLKQQVADTVQLQRWTGGIGMAIAMLLALSSVVAINAAAEATRLRENLYGRRPVTRTLSQP